MCINKGVTEIIFEKYRKKSLKNIAYSKNVLIFAPLLRNKALRIVVSGCSAVRLAHLFWEQRVPGSNPGTPTQKKANRKLLGTKKKFRGVAQSG